jgi:hypothetical protein
MEACPNFPWLHDMTFPRAFKLSEYVKVPDDPVDPRPHKGLGMDDTLAYMSEYMLLVRGRECVVAA